MTYLTSHVTPVVVSIHVNICEYQYTACVVSVTISIQAITYDITETVSMPSHTCDICDMRIYT